MPDDTAPRPGERAEQPRAQAEKPAGREQDDEQVGVVYHGPNDVFVHDTAHMVRNGSPARLSRSALEGLRSRFPGHDWSEVPIPRD